MWRFRLMSAAQASHDWIAYDVTVIDLTGLRVLDSGDVLRAYARALDGLSILSVDHSPAKDSLCRRGRPCARRGTLRACGGSTSRRRPSRVLLR